MSLEYKALNIVLKLIRLTQDNHLHWQRIDNPAELAQVIRGGGDWVQTVYRVQHAGNWFRLYEVKATLPVMGVFPIKGPRVELEITDAEGKVLWPFPPMQPLADLLRAVEAKMGGIERRLDQILAS